MKRLPRLITQQYFKGDRDAYFRFVQEWRRLATNKEVGAQDMLIYHLVRGSDWTKMFSESTDYHTLVRAFPFFYSRKDGRYKIRPNTITLGNTWSLFIDVDLLAEYSCRMLTSFTPKGANGVHETVFRIPGGPSRVEHPYDSDVADQIMGTLMTEIAEKCKAETANAGVGSDD